MEQHMSEEAAKRAWEFLIRCYWENLGYEAVDIKVQRKEDKL